MVREVGDGCPATTNMAPFTAIHVKERSPSVDQNKKKGNQKDPLIFSVSHFFGYAIFLFLLPIYPTEPERNHSTPTKYPKNASAYHSHHLSLFVLSPKNRSQGRSYLPFDPFFLLTTPPFCCGGRGCTVPWVNVRLLFPFHCFLVDFSIARGRHPCIQGSVGRPSVSRPSLPPLANLPHVPAFFVPVGCSHDYVR